VFVFESCGSEEIRRRQLFFQQQRSRGKSRRKRRAPERLFKVNTAVLRLGGHFTVPVALICATAGFVVAVGVVRLIFRRATR